MDTNLYTTDGTSYIEAITEEVLTAARAILSRKFRKGVTLDSPSARHRYLRHSMAELPYEVHSLIYLDNRHSLLACQDLFRGTIDGASVRARLLGRTCARSACKSGSRRARLRDL